LADVAAYVEKFAVIFETGENDGVGRVPGYAGDEEVAQAGAGVGTDRPGFFALSCGLGEGEMRKGVTYYGVDVG
jgi:hypothetical protein